MPRRYRPLVFIAILLLAAGCGAVAPQPTAEPFVQHTANDALIAMMGAGLSVRTPVQDLIVGRGAPGNYSDRYVFAIERIAPEGGQVIVFQDPAGLTEWQNYIEGLRANSETRREVVYVYVKDNLLLQLSSDLTTEEAEAYRDAFMGIE